MREKKLTIRQIAMIGVMTAVICILAPFSIPIGVIPVTFTNLAVYISIYALGKQKGTLSCLIYLLIGLVGIPVFSGFTGGPGKLFGPTGGYLIGFLFMAWIAGIFIDRFQERMYLCFLGMVLGTAVCYLLGTSWLAFQASMTFTQALAAGVLPFIPGDLIKIILAMLIGPQIRKALRKAGLY